MQLADFLSAVFFYLKVGENLNQNWIVENLNNAFSTWNGKLGELWGLVTTGPQTFKGGAVWSVMQTLHNGMVGMPTFSLRDRFAYRKWTSKFHLVCFTIFCRGCSLYVAECLAKVAGRRKAKNAGNLGWRKVGFGQ